MSRALRLTISCIALAVSLGFAATFSSGSPSLVSAAPGDGITAYISPPFVQGPPSNISSATIEDFDSSNFCTTLGSRAVGTFSGACTQFSGGVGGHKWGGANTTTDQPTIGGTASPFVSPPSGGLTLTFPSASARYVGFWWSAGSAGNTVEFYSKVGSSDVLVATFTSTPINQLLNTSGVSEASVLPPNPYPGTQVVTALNGSPYLKGYYFGRPKDHSSLTPVSMPFTSGGDNIYSHAYLNVFASGAVSFSKVVFIGPGFEMDNVAVSDLNQTPSPELVLLQSVLGKSVEFRPNGGTGTMPAQTSDTSTTLTPIGFTRNGHTFAGWSTSPTGAVEYLDGAEYVFGSDVTLHAIWTLNTYNVTYEEHGGTPVTDGTFTHGGTLTFPTAPTRSDDTFRGWFLAPTGGTAQTEEQVAAGNATVTLHAQWAPNGADPIDPSVPSFQFASDTALPETR